MSEQGWDYQNHGNWNVLLEHVIEYERCSRQVTVRRAVPFHAKSVCCSVFQCTCRTSIFSSIKYKDKTQEQSTFRHDRLTDAWKAAGLSYHRNRARLGNSVRYAEELYGLVQGERRRDQWALDIARVKFTWSSGEGGLCVRGYQVVQCLYILYSYVIFSTNMRLILAYIFPQPLGPSEVRL